MTIKRPRVTGADNQQNEIHYMAGFRKAKAEQAFLKMGLYGPPGSGKTLTALLIAEGLCKISKKRIKYVDTERGTDFYSQAVVERMVHPDAFDFDALYTRSITDVATEIYALDLDTGVIVLDSVTHIWEACKEAYQGKLNKIGAIPIHAWGKIKKPYKDLISYLLSFPAHVIFCGRQGNEFSADEETDELKKTGVKMKAESDTPYEPHIMIRMEQIRDGNGGFTIQAVPEKDRSSLLTGKVIQMRPEPGYAFEQLCRPLLHLLGDKQGKIESTSDTAARDAEVLTEQDVEKEQNSQIVLDEFTARITLARSTVELKAIGKEITSELKKGMTTDAVSTLRERYLEAEKKLK